MATGARTDLTSAIPDMRLEASLPEDEGLPGLRHAFDGRWVWEAYCDQFGAPEELPTRLKLRQISYSPGYRALVSYAAEWPRGDVFEEDEFAIEVRPDQPRSVSRFPHDPRLPGLVKAASAPDAQDLLSRHVPIVPRTLKVETVRYRPTSRAVLRHITRWQYQGGKKVSFFARVMPPSRVARLLTAAELAGYSGFHVPSIVGVWEEGGVVWLNKVRGHTVRRRIRRGKGPGAGVLLDKLSQLWSGRMEEGRGEPFELLRNFRSARRLLRQVLTAESARQACEHVLGLLYDFAHEWKPTALAHNDFYDDQIIMDPDGGLTLVDFEEAGPGDPMLDVGNLLAHMLWMERFLEEPQYGVYHDRIWDAALDRFGWDPMELRLRVAYALFRLATNPVRRLRSYWQEDTEVALRMAADVIESA